MRGAPILALFSHDVFLVCDQRCGPSRLRHDSRNRSSAHDLAHPTVCSGACTVLTRIRQRLGVDVFQRFFERIVDTCVKDQADVIGDRQIGKGWAGRERLIVGAWRSRLCDTAAA